MPPTRIFTVNAIYPEEAKAARIEGAVVIRITIGEDGSVTGFMVLRSVPIAPSGKPDKHALAALVPAP